MQRNSNFEERDYRQLYAPKGNKFVIGTVTGSALEIVAQYNPKELARTATATWTAHPNTSHRQSKSGDNMAWMEYGTSEPRSLTLELLFDGYEEGISIAATVESLESLTLPLDKSSRTLHHRHPQLCVAVWGTQTLRCVVMSVATKLTMFDASGEPLRAVCSVTLKEVDVIAMMDDRAAKQGYDTRLSALHKQSGGESHERRRHWSDDRPIVDANLRAQLHRTDGPPSSTEPAWTPPPDKAANPARSAQPANRTPVDGVEHQDDQDLADDHEIQAQNEQDARDDAAAEAAVPTPTATVAGTKGMPGGTYEVGVPSADVDPETIESSDPAGPTEANSGPDVPEDWTRELE